MKTSFDIQTSPMLVAWELGPEGRSQDALIGDQRVKLNGRELSTVEAQKLLGEIAELQPAVFVFTGENAVRRADLCELVHSAARQGLHPMLAVSGSGSLSRELLTDLKNAGLWRLQLTLNGSSAELHDLLEGSSGSFARTIDALRCANTWRIPVQINTNVSTRNAHDLEALAAVLKTSRIQLWNLTFPVPADLNHADKLPSAAEFESIFARLYEISLQVPFKVKTTEAAHYRRYVLQQRARTKSQPRQEVRDGVPGVMPVHEARATVFISRDGEVYAGSSLPIPAGNVRFQNVADIYRHSEIFTSLRNPAYLTGKCGGCNFVEICGGSRGRALSMLGDMFTEDVSCIYHPPARTRAKTKAEQQKHLERTAMEKPV
jgi:AdoMet-dependent heme synthase